MTLDTTTTSSVIIPFLLELWSTRLQLPITMKKRLKIKCSVHPNFSKIPPQEQGIKELKFKIRIIYVVKTVIKPTDK